MPPIPQQVNVHQHFNQPNIYNYNGSPSQSHFPGQQSTDSALNNSPYSKVQKLGPSMTHGGGFNSFGKGTFQGADFPYSQTQSRSMKKRPFTGRQMLGDKKQAMQVTYSYNASGNTNKMQASNTIENQNYRKKIIPNRFHHDAESLYD